MIKVLFETPSLYADHHVIEIRRVLLAQRGVLEVYASSYFRMVEVSYDPEQIDAGSISHCLEVSGYLDQLPVANEKGGYSHNPDEKATSFRKTRNNEQVSTAIAFKQDVLQEPRSGWPCPGMGLLKPE